MGKEITVLIDSESPGSGVIIKQTGNTYTVITAYHVVKNSNLKYQIVTPDNQRYQLNYQTVKRLDNNIDLAILQFTGRKYFNIEENGVCLTSKNQRFWTGDNSQMDTLTNYRQIIEKILKEYAALPYAYGELERELIIDKSENSYLLLTIGWENKQRVHDCLIHIDIINNLVWIQRDGTEDGITNELVNAGIPKNQIVLAFHPVNVRKHTEYAIGV
jgi:hypothetical protein